MKVKHKTIPLFNFDQWTIPEIIDRFNLIQQEISGFDLKIARSHDGMFSDKYVVELWREETSDEEKTRLDKQKLEAENAEKLKELAPTIEELKRLGYVICKSQLKPFNS